MRDGGPDPEAAVVHGVSPDGGRAQTSISCRKCLWLSCSRAAHANTHTVTSIAGGVGGFGVLQPSVARSLFLDCLGLFVFCFVGLGTGTGD